MLFPVIRIQQIGKVLTTQFVEHDWNDNQKDSVLLES